MKKKTAFRFIRRKLIGLISLSLGIHFIIAHANKVFPFGLGVENNIFMFIWAYTGGLIGVVFATYGIAQLFQRTVNKILDKIGE